VKRDLLAAGVAARRKVHQPSAPFESPPTSVSTGSSPTPIHADTLLLRETLALVSQNLSPAILAPVITGSTCSLAEGLSALSSSGFAALNEERTSKKRSRVDMHSGNVEEENCARTKADKDGSATRGAVKPKLENDDDVVYVETKQTASLLELN
jgi:hypothetical protein